VKLLNPRSDDHFDDHQLEQIRHTTTFDDIATESLSLLATRLGWCRTSIYRFVVRWLERLPRLALHGKQAEKRVIFYLEQFPGDLAV
jgi:hypothetical protein